ncbi:MAG: leucine-rich repeat domain-containing protein [Chlamydiia bacterium]
MFGFNTDHFPNLGSTISHKFFSKTASNAPRMAQVLLAAAFRRPIYNPFTALPHKEAPRLVKNARLLSEKKCSNPLLTPPFSRKRPFASKFSPPRMIEPLKAPERSVDTNRAKLIKVLNAWALDAPSDISTPQKAEVYPSILQPHNGSDRRKVYLYVFPGDNGAKKLEARSRILEAYDQGRTSLDLSNLQLTDLPEELSLFMSLEELNLSKNQLENLDFLLPLKKQLKSLNLSGNKLESIPAEVYICKQLQELNLADNQIEVVAPNIKGFEQLKRLFLQNNRLKEENLHNLYKLPLEELDLSRNQLEHFPENLLSRSNKKRREWLPNTTLKKLFLNDNKIKDDRELLKHFIELKELHLAFNQFPKIPASLTQLIQLETLDLSNNIGLTSEGYPFDKLPRLNTLDLSGCLPFNEDAQTPKHLIGLLDKPGFILRIEGF